IQRTFPADSVSQHRSIRASFVHGELGRSAAGFHAPAGAPRFPGWRLARSASCRRPSLADSWAILTMVSYAAPWDQTRVAEMSLKLRCPACFASAGDLNDAATEGSACLSCGYRVECAEGILRAVIPERRKFYD